MPSGTSTHHMQASEERGVAHVAPLPTHLARPSNIPRLADAQVAPPREELLFQGFNQAPFNIDGLGEQQERI